MCLTETPTSVRQAKDQRIAHPSADHAEVSKACHRPRRHRVRGWRAGLRGKWVIWPAG